MNTKRAAVVFLCSCMAFAFIAGCKVIKQQHVTTLQGTLFNAITGERIGGTDVRWYLEQGTTTRSKPDVFYTGAAGSGDTSIDLMGDFAFANIPSADTLSTGSTDVLPNEYRLTVIKDGFQRFEGIIDQDMLANQDNVIKNIYLFPLDYLIPDYTYTATYNGKPVPGATITASPYATLNPGILLTDKWLSIDLGSGTADIFTLFNNNYFFPAPGYLANISHTTDANGQVTFLSSELATGGAYAVCITVPEDFEDTQLSGTTLSPVIEVGCKILVTGFSDKTQTFILDPVKDAGNPYGLYVTSISNTVDDQVDPSGTLTMTFNIPVTLGGPTVGAPLTEGFGITFSAATAAVFPAAPASRVDADLSPDGLTLTLTPTWTTEPAATDTGQTITYTDNFGYLIVNGYPLSVVKLSTLGDVAEDTISTKVQVAP